MQRLTFIRTSCLFVASFLLPSFGKKSKLSMMTVKGLIDSVDAGVCLEHEHVLVDFSGADKYNPTKWNRDEVILKVLPYLQELKENGCSTFFECTPEYLGRDVSLLLELSNKTGLNILTNTGYYGASNNKYLPEQAYTLDASQLADIWTKEYESGIQGTSVKPGFIKIGVDPEPLNSIHEKLVLAAGLTHMRTGLTITSHTGPASTAFQELEVLKHAGVHPSAFVWIHAQNEKEWSNYLKAAKMGSWISLDGLHNENVGNYSEMLVYLKEKKLLEKVLVSHDAGWYDPEKLKGGTYRNYNTLFEKLIPRLRSNGFSENEINQILVVNPADAFSIRVRKF